MLRGFGWDLMADKEVAFTVDLRTGRQSRVGRLLRRLRLGDWNAIEA